MIGKDLYRIRSAFKVVALVPERSYDG